MHDWPIPASLKAVGRAGAGVNNIPVPQMTAKGICVFNAPGANANAVKELVIAGMLMAARNICPAWDYTRKLQGTDAELSKQVESGKKQFVGIELPNRTLGVIGLGAIGVKVANAARALGMRVIGYDPHITVSNAWQLSSQVEQVDVYKRQGSRCADPPDGIGSVQVIAPDQQQDDGGEADPDSHRGALVSDHQWDISLRQQAVDGYSRPGRCRAGWFAA